MGGVRRVLRHQNVTEFERGASYPLNASSLDFEWVETNDGQACGGAKLLLDDQMRDLLRRAGSAADRPLLLGRGDYTRGFTGAIEGK